MYLLDIAGPGSARIWIIGLFAPMECPDLLRGGMELQLNRKVCI